MSATRVVFTAILLVGLLTGGLVFAEKVEKSPGYFDLNWIKIPDGADEIQDIDLKAALKGLAAEARESGDDEFAELLSLVKSVRVKGFSLDKDSAKETEQSVQKVQNMLKDQGWDSMIYLKDDGEIVNVTTKSVDGKMVGVTAVVYEPGDAVVFVNVVGNLNLGTLLNLAHNFDEDDFVDVLGDFQNYDDD